MPIALQDGAGLPVDATPAQLVEFKTYLALQLLNNTADVDKPVSTLMAQALAAKADAAATTAALAAKADGAATTAAMNANAAALTAKADAAATTAALNAKADGAATTAALTAKADTAAMTAAVAAVVANNMTASTTVAPSKSAVLGAIAAMSGTGNAETMAETAFGMAVACQNGSPTIAAVGVSGLNVLDGCAATSAAVATDVGLYRPRVRYLAAATAINRVAGASILTAMRFDSGGTYNGGFPVVFEAAASDATVAASFFMGFTGSTAPVFTNVEPSGYGGGGFDLLGAGWDSSVANSSNLCIMQNDNVGPVVVVDLGASFAKAQGQLFRLVIDKNAAGTEFYVKAVKVVVGGVNIESSTYTLTANIPRGTLAFYPCFARSSMASVAQVSFDFAGFYRGKLPSSGTQNLLVNPQTATAYTLAASDALLQVEMNNAAPNTLTIPLNATVPFPIGQIIPVVQTGVGATTIAIAAGGTLQKPSLRSYAISAQYESAQLHQIAIDTWRVVAS